MKRLNLSQPTSWLKIAGSGAMLFASVFLSQSQTITNGLYIIDQFDTDDSGLYSDAGWGGNATAVFNSNTNNAVTTVAGAPNNAGSGSLEWQIAWQYPVNTGDQDVSGITGLSPAASPNGYTNISFDIMFLPDSATDALDTTYGVLEPTFFGANAGWWEYTFASINFPVTNGNGWLHVNIPLDNSGGGAPGMGSDTITGFGFKMQQSKAGLIGTTDFLIDNIMLEPATAPTPRPKMFINRVNTPPGLAFVIPASLQGGNGDGALIDAADPVNGLNFSWVGATTNPVVYSMTITNFPSAAYSNMQAVCYLVPGGGYGDLAINTVAATAAQIIIQNNADGSATASFGWKTNNAGAEPVTVASLTSLSGAVGTWELTFLNDTNVTLSGPGGLSTNIDLPGESVAQQFVNPLTLYYGAFNAGTTNNGGQIVTFSELGVSGTPNSTPPPIGEPSNPIYDVFANDGGVINTTYWTVNGGTIPNNIFIMQATNLYWVGWSLPLPTGDDLLAGATLGAGSSWAGTGLATNNPVSLGNANEAILNQGSLPASGQGFFKIGPTP